MARETHSFPRDSVQGRRLDEAVASGAVGVATELVESDEEDVHLEACSTNLCM